MTHHPMEMGRLPATIVRRSLARGLSGAYRSWGRVQQRIAFTGGSVRALQSIHAGWISEARDPRHGAANFIQPFQIAHNHGWMVRPVLFN